MAYDEDLAERVRVALEGWTDFTQRRMFGGLAFMVNTHMACGCLGEDLMVRVGKAHHDEALAMGALEMDFTGRPMRGMVVVPAARIVEETELEAWVERAVRFAEAEPPKPPKPPKPARGSRA